MKTEKYKLDERLACAASFVRDGSVAADIGTDHAYIPIYLVKEGISKRAVAADINKGPLENARTNIEEAGLAELISLSLTDGLKGIEAYCPTDILICGMGGELIEKIISEAPFTKDPSIRLILQPMSKQELLRAYLLSAGYNIVDEKLSLDDGRVYQCICAEYDGKVREYSDTELLLGRHNIEERTELFFRLLDAKIAAEKKRIDGIKTSGKEAKDKERLLANLEKLKEN